MTYQAKQARSNNSNFKASKNMFWSGLTQYLRDEYSRFVHTKRVACMVRPSYNAES